MHSKVKGAQINLRHFVSIMSVNLNGRVFEIGLHSDWLKMLCYYKLSYFFCCLSERLRLWLASECIHAFRKSQATC